jgi:hypothetical protein
VPLLEHLPRAELFVALQELPQAAIGTALAEQLGVHTLAATIVELAIVFQTPLVVVIV